MKLSHDGFSSNTSFSTIHRYFSILYNIMIVHSLDKSSTFDQTFVTKAVTLHVSELLALCNYSESHGYIQPNVNHHFINENRSFQDLDKALKAAVKEDTTISTEYDAVLTRKVKLEPSSFQLQLPTYNAVTEEKTDEGVVIVDTHVLDGFLKILPTLKNKVAVHKWSEDVVEGEEGEGNGSHDARDGNDGGAGGNDGEVVENTDGGDGGDDAENGNGGDNGRDGNDGQGSKNDGEMAENNSGGNGEETGGVGNDGKTAFVESEAESGNGGETGDVGSEVVSHPGEKNGLVGVDTNPFVQFVKEMNSICGGLCLSFLDGLHRSYSLVSFAAESKENFHSLLSCSMNVTVNFYVLKPSQDLQDNPSAVPGLEDEWFDNIIYLKKEDIEFILTMTQDKSGTLMLSKKATVGHTVLDAYSVLSRSIRNNSSNVYFASATYHKKIKHRKTYKHVLLDYTSGKSKHVHLDKLNSRLFLEKFFKNFFFNHGFEEWAKQGLPMNMKRRILKEDGSFNIESLFKGVSFQITCSLLNFSYF